MGANDREWPSDDPARTKGGRSQDQESKAGGEQRERRTSEGAAAGVLAGRDDDSVVRPVEVASALHSRPHPLDTGVDVARRQAKAMRRPRLRLRLWRRTRHPAWCS
jgi:hypothetical protein